MTEKELRDYKRAFERRTKEMVSSKESARTHLIEAGIYDKAGNLRKEYSNRKSHSSDR